MFLMKINFLSHIIKWCLLLASSVKNFSATPLTLMTKENVEI